MDPIKNDNNIEHNSNSNNSGASNNNASENQSAAASSNSNEQADNNQASREHAQESRENARNETLQHQQQEQQHAQINQQAAEDHPYVSDGTTLGDAHQNASETQHAVSDAGKAMSDFLDGKANIVDAAMAVKGAYDSVTQLSGKLSASLMMPVMKALSAFKGQAILPAAKQMDPVIGIDVHMVNIPPSPAPIPMPHPYIGILFNAKDWVSCLINTFKKDALDALPPPAEDDKSVMASIAKNKEAIAGIAMGLANMGASVKFGDVIPRAITGTPCKNIPHIPMGAGFFPAFDAAVAKNDGKAFLGSFFVVADGDPMVGSFHLNYDCWDIGVVDLFKALRGGGKIKEPAAPEPGAPKAELFVPSGTVMPIPIGRPVLVNSIPTPINPLAILDKLFKAGLSKLKAAGRRAAQRGLDSLNGKVGCGPLTAASHLIGTGQSHPVDVASGHFYTNNTDFNLPGPIPFVWERIWHSYSSYKGPLGHGWHHSYDMALAVDYVEKVAIMRLSDGRVANFNIPETGKESYNRGEKLTLYLHEEGYYYASDKKNLIYRFTEKEHFNPYNKTQTHLLQSVANRNGFAIRFNYNEKCLLTEITDSAGRKLIVNSNDEGHITSIDAPDPRYQGRTTFPIASYTYTNEGNMASQANALDQRMHFEYANHLMIREVWRNGCVWQFKYDKPEGIDAKCIEVWGSGDLLHYKFNYIDPQCTIAINSRGFKKTFYHKNGVVIRYVDPLNAIWDKRYNEFNELEWETDPLGNQKLTTYDQWGNMESVTEANGAFMKTTYGSGILKHSPIESVDVGGGKWKWKYDDQVNLIMEINPVNAEIQYKYIDGYLKKIITANNDEIILEYDNSYNLKKLVFSDGYETYWNYDILGNCIKYEDSVGNIRKTQFNLQSLPEIIQEPDGNTRYLEFDGEANIIHAKDKQYDIRYSYNYLSQIIEQSQQNNSINFRYDTEGNLLKVINEFNEEYLFEIDPADRVSKETGFDGISRSYFRDLAGKVIKVQRPGNKFTQYTYNEAGDINEVNYHDSSFEKYEYNKAGLILFAQNQNSSIHFERDLMGRVTKEINAEMFISYQYDKLNNRLNIKSSLGANINNEFDNIGHLIKVQANAWNSNITYNQLGLEIERILPGNITSQLKRDKLGRPVLQQIANNNSTVLHNREYSWDVNFRLKRITDSKTGITQFQHDEIGNLSKTIFSDGTEQFRNPDAAGNLFKSSNHIDRNYGKGGRLLTENNHTHKYDDEGNLIEKKDENGKIWQYQWSANSRLQSVIRPDGDTVFFTYDALGRRLSKKYKNTITRWLWDGNKPLHEWKENAQTGIILSDLNVNKNSIITWLFNEYNFTPIAKLKGEKSYSIISDHLGTPYQMYTNDGERFWEAQLDSYGKTKMHIGEEGSCPFRYQGQYEDKETGLYYNRFRYYDSSDGLYISQDPIRIWGGKRLYGYAHDPLLFVDVFGLVCSAAQLAANRAHGKAAEDDVRQELLARAAALGAGHEVLSQVTVQTAAGRRVIDHLIVDSSGTPILAVEVKSGGATRSTRQEQKDTALSTTGGTFVGGNARTVQNQTATVPTTVINRP